MTLESTAVSEAHATGSRPAAPPEESSQTGDSSLWLLAVFCTNFLPVTPEGYAERLRAFEQARGPLFDEEQFAEWRRELLMDVADPRKDWVGTVLWTLGLLAVALGVSYAGYELGLAPAFWGGLAVASSLVLTLAILGRLTHQIRRLTLEQRLLITDFLLSEGLIDAAEAEEMRSRSSWYHGGEA